MDSACELNTMSEEDELRLRNRELKKEMLDKIVESMRQCFGLTFFGVDVIIEDKTGNYVVIDINNFRECACFVLALFCFASELRRLALKSLNFKL